MKTPLWKWKVAATATGERADLTILRALETGEGEWEFGEPISCSRSHLQRLMDDGKVTADGSAVRASAKLRSGALIVIEVPSPRTLEAKPENLPIDILFQDEHILVVNKPPGLTVHPSATKHEGTLVNALLHHIKNLSGIGGVLRPGIVHRIDKDTSGALVVTKSDAAHRALSEVFAKHSIERVYWALCYGSTSSRNGTIESRIGRNPADRKKMTMNVKGGRHAVTHFHRVEEYAVPRAKPFASWLELRLETGRTHQIRVHLTGLGHSIFGDPVYGTPSARQPKWLALPPKVKETVTAMPGQALHARVLGFKHPITGQNMRFEAELPPSFAELHQALQRYR